MLLLLIRLEKGTETAIRTHIDTETRTGIEIEIEIGTGTGRGAESRTGTGAGTGTGMGNMNSGNGMMDMVDVASVRREGSTCLLGGMGDSNTGNQRRWTCCRSPLYSNAHERDFTNMQGYCLNMRIPWCTICEAFTMYHSLGHLVYSVLNSVRLIKSSTVLKSNCQVNYHWSSKRYSSFQCHYSYPSTNQHRHPLARTVSPLSNCMPVHPSASLAPQA